MALSFDGFDGLFRDLQNLAAVDRDGRAQEILQKSAEEVRDLAKEEMGHYQPSIGPFQAWPELKDSTKARRVSQGYTENDPLLMSGQMQRDMEVIQVTNTYADVGIPHGAASRKYAAVQELGSVTKGIPARSYLQTALWRHQETYVDRIFEMVEKRLKP